MRPRWRKYQRHRPGREVRGSGWGRVVASGDVDKIDPATGINPARIDPGRAVRIHRGVRDLERPVLSSACRPEEVHPAAAVTGDVVVDLAAADLALPIGRVSGAANPQTATVPAGDVVSHCRIDHIELAAVGECHTPSVAACVVPRDVALPELEVGSRSDPDAAPVALGEPALDRGAQAGHIGPIVHPKDTAVGACATRHPVRNHEVVESDRLASGDGERPVTAHRFARPDDPTVDG